MPLSARIRSAGPMASPTFRHSSQISGSLLSWSGVRRSIGEPMTPALVVDPDDLLGGVLALRNHPVSAGLEPDRCVLGVFEGRRRHDAEEHALGCLDQGSVARCDAVVVAGRLAMSQDQAAILRRRQTPL